MSQVMNTLNLSLLSTGVGDIRRKDLRYPNSDTVRIHLEPEDYSAYWCLRQLQNSNDVEGNHETIPKTYTTRKGALMLFSEDLLAYKYAIHKKKKKQKRLRRLGESFSEEQEDVTLRNNTNIMESTQKDDMKVNGLGLKESDESLRTVDDLAASILRFGSNDDINVSLKFIYSGQKAKIVRPGFSARRYLASWSRYFDDKMVEKMISSGLINEKTLFQRSAVLPNVKRRINDNLSEYPMPYRIMKQMLIAPGPLNEFSFVWKARPEESDLYDSDDIMEGDISVLIQNDNNSHFEEVSYSKLEVDLKKTVLSNLLLKTALNHAIKKQEEVLKQKMVTFDDLSSQNEMPVNKPVSSTPVVPSMDEMLTSIKELVDTETKLHHNKLSLPRRDGFRGKALRGITTHRKPPEVEVNIPASTGFTIAPMHGPPVFLTHTFSQTSPAISSSDFIMHSSSHSSQVKPNGWSEFEPLPPIPQSMPPIQEKTEINEADRSMLQEHQVTEVSNHVNQSMISVSVAEQQALIESDAQQRETPSDNKGSETGFLNAFLIPKCLPKLKSNQSNQSRQHAKHDSHRPDHSTSTPVLAPVYKTGSEDDRKSGVTTISFNLDGFAFQHQPKKTAPLPLSIADLEPEIEVEQPVNTWTAVPTAESIRNKKVYGYPKGRPGSRTVSIKSSKKEIDVHAGDLDATQFYVTWKYHDVVHDEIRHTVTPSAAERYQRLADPSRVSAQDAVTDETIAAHTATEKIAPEAALVDIIKDRVERIASQILETDNAGQVLMNDVTEAIKRILAHRENLQDNVSKSEVNMQPGSKDYLESWGYGNIPTQAEYKEMIKNALKTVVLKTQDQDLLSDDIIMSDEVLEQLVKMTSIQAGDIYVTTDPLTGKQSLHIRNILQEPKIDTETDPLYHLRVRSSKSKETNAQNVVEVDHNVLFLNNTAATLSPIHDDEKNKDSVVSIAPTEDHPQQSHDVLNSNKGNFDGAQLSVQLSPIDKNASADNNANKDDFKSAADQVTSLVEDENKETNPLLNKSGINRSGTLIKSVTAIESRSEFVVGKVENKEALKLLYGVPDQLLKDTDTDKTKAKKPGNVKQASTISKVSKKSKASKKGVTKTKKEPAKKPKEVSTAIVLSKAESHKPEATPVKEDIVLKAAVVSPAGDKFKNVGEDDDEFKDDSELDENYNYVDEFGEDYQLQESMNGGLPGAVGSTWPIKYAPRQTDGNENTEDLELERMRKLSVQQQREMRRKMEADKRRLDVERKRRERDEKKKQEIEEAERKARLEAELEEERRKREEEYRLAKQREKEEKDRLLDEQRQMDFYRIKQLEREKREKEEFRRKLEEMRRVQAEEELRRKEAELRKQMEAEELARLEQEMLSKMQEGERLEYERRKREEEERRRIEMEEARARSEREAQEAMEEARRLAEEMAYQKALIAARLNFVRELRVEAQGLERDTHITPSFGWSYFDLLNWLGLDILEFDRKTKISKD